MDTKLCPFCAEDIKSAAIKCKHCGEMLTDSSSGPLEKKASLSDVERTSGDHVYFQSGNVQVTSTLVKINSRSYQTRNISSVEVKGHKEQTSIGCLGAIATCLGLGLLSMVANATSISLSILGIGLLLTATFHKRLVIITSGQEKQVLTDWGDAHLKRIAKAIESAFR